jgi:hypothetical protein
MAETIAFIGLAAAILQLLEPGRQIVTSIYHMNSEHQILEERNRSVNVLLSLLSYLGSDSSTLEDEALLHHKAELMVLKKQWDEMVANHGSGKLRKIKTWLKAFTSEKKMDRKLASSRNDINTLTLRTIL